MKAPFFTSAGKKSGAVKNKKLPENLSGLLMYFSNIDPDSSFAPLNGRLIITSDDLGKDEDMVMGYVLNEPLMSFNDFTSTFNIKASDKLKFIKVMNGAVDDFEITEEQFLSVLLPKDKEPWLEQRDVFGDFSVRVCETLEEAMLIADRIQDAPFIVLDRQFIIERNCLRGLLSSDQGIWRKAEADIVFDTSALMRLERAFPEISRRFQIANDPAANLPFKPKP